jgi:predicted Zn finger-like uncharacterized protein
MQITCPHCGATVTAENINIQRMTAVCSACNSVFSFDIPTQNAKAKRRKVKLPPKLSLHDGDTLQMEFWTNFKLAHNEGFVLSMFMGIGAAFMALLLLGAGSKVPFIMPIFFLLAVTVAIYGVALTVINKTHIEMDEDTIRVTRKPIPNFLDQGNEVSLAGVIAIKYQETDASKKEGYDLPRYRVWAETADGSRRTIVNDVPEDYAVFITQQLDERLHADEEAELERLAERGTRLEHEKQFEGLEDDGELREAVRAGKHGRQ